MSKKKETKPTVKNKPKSGNLFKKAVENTPDIANCYQSGLQALSKHSKKSSFLKQLFVLEVLKLMNVRKQNIPMTRVGIMLYVIILKYFLLKYTLQIQVKWVLF